MVLKPSETSKAIEKILAEVLPRYLDQVTKDSGGLGLGSSRWGQGRGHVPTSEGPSVWGSIPEGGCACSCVCVHMYVYGGVQKSSTIARNRV